MEVATMIVIVVVKAILPFHVVVLETVYLLVISRVVVVDPVNFYILKNKKITTMYLKEQFYL